ncbi:MAG: thioredoxin-disulfide reductase [Thermoleophilaceae bacterium]|nr:thioredoxin-disulfide reductase [Thermoleophilaceae bacterium]
MSDNQFEIVIVGAGPAGLSAALYAGRSMVKTLVLERGATGGQLWNTAEVDNFPGIPDTTGPDLAHRFEEHAKKFGAEFEYGNVTNIARDGEGFVLTTDDDQTYRADAVIVTVGGEARKLGVPGEQELSGMGVSYCAVCDGAFFKDKPIAVVGGGDSALEEGEYLTRFGSKVYLVHRRDAFRASPTLVENFDSSDKTEKVLNSVVEEIVGNDKVTGLRVKNTETGAVSELPVEAVFPFVGFTPHSAIFDEGLVETDESGHIVTDQKMETKTPGLFAAGDVRSQFTRQISNAVGDATIAALAAAAHVAEVRRAATPA